MTTSETRTQPVDMIRSVYEAFARQDLSTLLELADPNIVLTQDPALPWGGRHVGRDGVIAFVTALVSATDSAVTVEALFQAGDTVVQYGRTRGTCRASGASFDIPECHVWTIHDDLIVEVAFFIDTALMLAALGTAAHA